MRLIDGDLIHKAIPAEEDNTTGMGMTFDEMDAYNNGIDAMYRLIQGATPIEAIPKADYENRLKADLVAMLTELQLEIKEKDADLRYCGHNLMAVDCIDIIQQKIDKLKEAKDGENNN